MTKFHLAAATAAGLSLCLLASSGPLRAAEKPSSLKVESAKPVAGAKADSGEEAGERARRQMSEQADRLEAEARRAMQSICRGC